MRPIIDARTYPRNAPACCTRLGSVGRRPQRGRGSSGRPCAAGRTQTAILRPVKAIRRFTVRTVLPPALAPLGELALNLRWSWDTTTQQLFESLDPALWDAGRGRPGAAARRARPGAARRAGRRPRRRRRVEAAPTTCGPTSRATAGTRAWPRQRRPASDDAVPEAIAYFSPGVRHHRRAAAVLRRPGHPGRRPPQGGVRPRRPDRRRRACSTGPATSRSRCPGRAGSRSATRCSTPTACRSRCCARPTASALKVQVGLPGGRHLVAQVWKAQVGRVPLLLLDSDVEDNEPAEREVTDRLYGGGSEHRLLQEMLLGIGGVRALRAYSRLTGAPAPDGVPHQRGPRRLPRRRAHPRADRGPRADLRRGRRGGPRRHPVHHPHPGPRRHRPVRAATWSPSTSAATTRSRASRSSGCSRWAPRTTRAATRGIFNMAVMGFRLAQRANGVSELHGHVAREMFARLWPGFDEPEVPIGYITNGVHAPTWVAPEVLELAGPELVERPDRPESAWDDVSRVPDADIWAVRGLLRGRLVADARRRVRQLLGAARRQRGRARLGRQDPRPRRAHHRLRPPGAVVQAADPDAARPGAADRAAHAPRAADPDRDRRQGAPGRRRRQEADPGAGAVRRHQTASATGSSSCPTTTSRWRRTSTRAATSG